MFIALCNDWNHRNDSLFFSVRQPNVKFIRFTIDIVELAVHCYTLLLNPNAAALEYFVDLTYKRRR